MGLVHKRTSLVLSLKSLHTRMTGRDLGAGRIKALEPQDAEKLFDHPADQLITRLDLQLVEQLSQSIKTIEANLLARSRACPLPGLADHAGGKDFRIDHHAGDGRSSVCQSGDTPATAGADSRRLSNEENERQIGSKYLAQAFVRRPTSPNATTQPAGTTARGAGQRHGGDQGAGLQAGQGGLRMMSQNADYDAGRMFPESEVVYGRAGANPRTVDCSLQPAEDWLDAPALPLQQVKMAVEMTLGAIRPRRESCRC